MQRFKKFAMAKGNIDAHGQPVVFGQRYGFALAHSAAGKSGKFTYGADGTLTQAARWRSQAFRSINHQLFSSARQHLERARKAGFKLPA